MDRDQIVTSLKEMFPNIPETEVTNKLQSLAPQQRRLEVMVEYCLAYTEKKEQLSSNSAQDNDSSEIMEMISLEPEVLILSEEERKKQEEADAFLAKKLSEEEFKPNRKSTSIDVDLTESPKKILDAKPSPSSTQVSSPSASISSQNQKPATSTSQIPTKSSSVADQLQMIRAERHNQWKSDHPNAKPVKHKVGNYQLQSQLKDVREKYSQHWRTTSNSRKRVWTTADLEKHNKMLEDTRAEWGGNTTNHKSVHTINNTFSDPIRIGKESLEFTNEFRKKNGLGPLKWHQVLCDIGVKHSKDMGDGKVPFGHQGFNERVRQYPFHARGAAENVAMNHGMADVARVAVDGWIQSPGHRKNLLNKSMEYCGIGVYQNAKGAWYLTQLFGV